jgi:hypothetical protein
MLTHSLSGFNIYTPTIPFYKYLMLNYRLAFYMIHALALAIWVYIPSSGMLSFKIMHMTVSMASFLLI